MHYLNKFESDVTVLRNDEFSIDELEQFDRIVLSPGPGLPADAGKLLDVIRTYGDHKKILGICLGMQALAAASGGTLTNLESVHHGVAIAIDIIDSEEPLFFGIPSSFLTGRYHSWCVNGATLPEVLKVTAIDPDGEIMSLTHQNQLLRGVQFHPESILTEWGSIIISNWLYKC